MHTYNDARAFSTLSSLDNRGLRLLFFFGSERTLFNMEVTCYMVVGGGAGRAFVLLAMFVLSLPVSPYHSFLIPSFLHHSTHSTLNTLNTHSLHTALRGRTASHGPLERVPVQSQLQR